jgi:tRNA-dihydrouridine synthase
VIGNGDIRTPEDAAAMVEKTGCDAVMIGRAAPANPWIFRQIAQYTATGSYDVPGVMDRYNMIRAYFEMLLAEEIATRDLPRDGRMGDPVGKMKQFATWFTHGVPGGAKLRAAIYHAHTGSEVLFEVEQFFMARLEAGTDAEFEPAESAANEPAGLADALLVCD